MDYCYIQYKQNINFVAFKTPLLCHINFASTYRLCEGNMNLNVKSNDRRALAVCLIFLCMNSLSKSELKAFFPLDHQTFNICFSCIFKVSFISQ